MRDRDLEHPDVSAAQRTGYAAGRGPKVAAFCSECGEPIYVGDYALKARGWGWICHDCVWSQMVMIEEEPDE